MGGIGSLQERVLGVSFCAAPLLTSGSLLGKPSLDLDSSTD